MLARSLYLGKAQRTHPQRHYWVSLGGWPRAQTAQRSAMGWQGIPTRTSGAPSLHSYPLTRAVSCRKL